MNIAMKNGHQRIVEELLGVKDESTTCVKDESATCDDEDADKRGTCTEEEKAPVQKVTKVIVYHVHMHAWELIAECLRSELSNQTSLWNQTLIDTALYLE